MMNILGSIKNGLTTALLFLVAILGATILFMRNQRTEAKQTLKNVKRDLNVSETLRESEKIIQEAVQKTRKHSYENERIFESRKANDDRPDVFGDPRINDRLQQRSKGTSDTNKS